MNGHTSTRPRAPHDFYPTPPVATHSLLEHVRFEGEVWEPASGDGALSQVLLHHGLSVQSSDLRPEGFGTGGRDFLATTTVVDNIVTNPPYSLAEKFIRHALACSRRKSAFLVRLAFLESEARYHLFREHPPTLVLVLSRRLPFRIEGQWCTGASFGHCWIVWDRDHRGPTVMEWSK